MTGKTRQRPDAEILQVGTPCPYTEADVYLTSALIEMFNNITDHQVSYKVNNKGFTEVAENKPEEDQKKEVYDTQGTGETKVKFNIKVLKRIGEGS